jgi:hypothetical protein
MVKVMPSVLGNFSEIRMGKFGVIDCDRGMTTMKNESLRKISLRSYNIGDFLIRSRDVVVEFFVTCLA